MQLEENLVNLSLAGLKKDGELAEFVHRVVEGKELDRMDYLRLMQGLSLESLTTVARQVRNRDDAKNKTVTFSKKVFAPVITYCRDRCRYCGYRRDPGDSGAWVMKPSEVKALALKGAKAGCTELLIMSGERPDYFKEVRRILRGMGFSSFMEYIVNLCESALEAGILPHSNIGIASRKEMAELKKCNPSIGLMLENISERLTMPGGPHDEAPSKNPKIRTKTIETAGELKIPFTTGILIGIGETKLEVIDSLLYIKQVHKKYGHIQEIIIQNFRAKKGTPMESHPEPTLEYMMRTIAIARIILGSGFNIQAPPNLALKEYPNYLDAGINDWGGVSPITLDYVNPEAPWPMLRELREKCTIKGYRLKQRLPVYPEYIKHKRDYIHANVLPYVDALADELGYAKVM